MRYRYINTPIQVIELLFEYEQTFLEYIIIQCVMIHRNLIGRSLKSRIQIRGGIERSNLHSQPQESKNLNTGNSNLLYDKEIEDILRSLSLESNEMAKVYVENYSHEADSPIDDSSESPNVYPKNSYVYAGRDEENETVQKQKDISPIWTYQSLPSKSNIFDYSDIYLTTI